MERGIFLRLRQGFAGRIVLCLLLFIFCGKGVMAEEPVLKSEYSYRRYTVHDGLPEMICTSLFQDSKGYIWIGTLSGFARYDGYTFKSFHATSEEGIAGFYENKKGDVSGIALRQLHQADIVTGTVHSRNTVSSVKNKYEMQISNSLPCGYSIFQIDGSRAIYAFSDSGLVKIWEHEKLNDIDESHKPFWDKTNKRFWVPTPEGTYIINENGVITDSFAIKTIKCFIPYKKGFRAVADDGLYEYDNRVLKQILKYPFYSNNLYGFSISEDTHGDDIIRAENSIFRYSDGKLETIVSDMKYIWDMILDKEGNLWVASAGGLYNFYGLNFKKHTLAEEKNILRSVMVDNDNNIWLASMQGDLLRFKNEKAEKIIYPKTKYVFFDENSIIHGNDMYLTGGGGILHCDISKKSFNWLDLPEDMYFNVVPLSADDLAISNFEAAYIYRKGKGIIRQYDISVLKQQILSAVKDEQGRLLLGGSAGIVIIDGDSVRYIMNTDISMCRNMIYDRSGTLWLTSKNNLVSIKSDQQTIEHTFPNSLIRSLYITRNNVMVVATIDAVYLAKNDGGKLDFVRYDQYNGYNILGASTTPLAEDDAGNVWLLTLEGAVTFNPEELLRKQPIPKIYVQSMQSSNDNIAWTEVKEEHPQLKYNDNNTKFSYVALCYSSVGNVRYHYRLLGFQNNWSEPTKQREITFNNLPPGDYTFEIYADAGTDESRCETQSFAFSIKPAFWQTAWFIVACIAFLMLASAGVALYIQRRKNKILLEKLRAEKELNELRISGIRLKAIPHFNANVLAAIEYYIANRTKEEAMRILGIYSDFTYKTLSEVDKAARPLDEELAYVKMYLDLEKIRFLDKFNFRIDVEKGVDKSVQLPNMILHTYCENAVKHGLMPLKSGGLLTIHVSQHEQIVCVSVEDNGVGRAYAAQNPHLHSSKQGLSILNRQIEIYNRFNREKINQQIDDLEKGTRFRVEVPLDYTYIN